MFCSKFLVPSASICLSSFSFYTWQTVASLLNVTWSHMCGPVCTFCAIVNLTLFKPILTTTKIVHSEAVCFCFTSWCFGLRMYPSNHFSRMLWTFLFWSLMFSCFLVILCSLAPKAQSNLFFALVKWSLLFSWYPSSLVFSLSYHLRTMTVAFKCSVIWRVQSRCKGRDNGLWLA